MAWIRRVTEYRDEHEVVWTGQPETTTDDQVLLPASDSVNQDYPDIDMTVPIQEMVSNPDKNYGFMIKLVTEVAHWYLWFASGDYEDSTLRPRLSITFIGCLLPESQFDYAISEDSVIFTDLSTSADTWLWNFGD